MDDYTCIYTHNSIQSSSNSISTSDFFEQSSSPSFFCCMKQNHVNMQCVHAYLSRLTVPHCIRVGTPLS